MNKLSSLLLAAALLVPTAARAQTLIYHTNLWITNGTNHFIYVDTFTHLGNLQHWGLVAPSDSVKIEEKLHLFAFFTDVYVYVKRSKNEDPADTICTVKKTFGNTGYTNTLYERVHFNGKTCTIDPA